MFHPLNLFALASVGIFTNLGGIFVGGQFVWRKLDYYFASNAGPPARQDMGMAFEPVRRFLIIFGGSNGTGHALGDTWVLDVLANRWYNATRPGGPPARFGMICGIWRENFYVTMGCNDTGSCFNDVWRFHVGNFTWTALKAAGNIIPQARRAAVGGIFPGSSSLVVSGGQNELGQLLSDTFMLELGNRRWYQMEGWQSTYDPSAPHPRARHAAAMIGPSKFIMFGGCVRHGPCPSADSWSFSSQSKLWTRLDLCAQARQGGKMAVLPIISALLAAALSTAVARGNATAVEPPPQYAVLYGGTNEGRQILSTESIDKSELALVNIRTKVWSRYRITQGEVPDERQLFGFASSPVGIFLLGGLNNSNGEVLRDLWILTGSYNPKTELLSPCSNIQFSLITLHGLFMFIAFGFLLQLGGFLAQYASTLDGDTCNWPYLHRVVQIIGYIFGTVGFICALLMIPNGLHFRSVHAVLGLVLFLMTSLQPVLGLLSRYLEQRRNAIMKVHYWSGLCILLLSLINISLGVFLALALPEIWISWFAYVFLLLITVCIIQTTDCCSFAFRVK